MTSLSGVEVLLSLPHGCFILAPGGAISIVAELQVALLLLFSINGVRVRGNDGDLALLGRPVTVGWEGEEHHLELRVWPKGRVRSDLI